MIEYLYKTGERSCEKEPLKVCCDGKLCGEIRKVIGGYQYFAYGAKCCGDIFRTVTEVQASLS